MKDMAGNELEVGMKVLITLPGYKHLVWAEVEKIAPKTAICSYEPSWSTTGRRQQVPRLPNQVVVPMTEKLKQDIEHDVRFNMN